MDGDEVLVLAIVHSRDEEGTKLVKHVLFWMKTNYIFCDENVRKAIITLILPFQQTVMKHEKKWKNLFWPSFTA